MCTPVDALYQDSGISAAITYISCRVRSDSW